MNESKTCQKLGNGFLVNEIRQKFAEYYEKSFKKPEPHIEDFDELMETLS